ncbi:hypothetical protein I3760_04G162300 [Carya illinoinensis]|nr:hypothetical protein I3760_04G162300 [Carya illinoinensis]
MSESTPKAIPIQTTPTIPCRFLRHKCIMNKQVYSKYLYTALVPMPFNILPSTNPMFSSQLVMENCCHIDTTPITFMDQQENLNASEHLFHC